MFSNIGTAGENNTFFVGTCYSGSNLVIKIKQDGRWQHFHFPNGIVQGQVNFSAMVANFNYPMARKEGLFFSIHDIEDGMAIGMIKKIIDKKMAATVDTPVARVSLNDLLPHVTSRTSVH